MNNSVVIDIATARIARENLRSSFHQATDHNQAQVENILSDGTVFYYENIDPMLYDIAVDFIRVVMQSGEVVISHQGPDLSKLSVISCRNEDGDIREFFMRDLTALIRSDGEVSDYNLRDTIWWLKQLQIDVVFRPHVIHHEKREITEEELEWYHPERMDIIQWSTEYTVVIMPRWTGENLGSSFTVDFMDPASCTLLDMILCAYDDVVTFHRVALEDYRVHIQSANWHRQSLTLVFSSQQVEDMIHPVLMDMGMLYRNLSFEKAWKSYFRTKIIPKMNKKF